MIVNCKCSFHQHHEDCGTSCYCPDLEVACDTPLAQYPCNYPWCNPDECPWFRGIVGSKI